MRHAIKLSALYGLSLALGFGVVAASCYATTGPKPPTCAQDPSQPGCLGPLHDQRDVGGRAKR